ncbi:MAG: hypothetical protein P8P42_00055 [Gammaproteobacteria bacterium]|nr:hypothetical protein [Gammaproteobacteria bacterium]MDG1951684.1 hypothetical protein [Gammaproteobacteria bacterium]MDG2117759.1 hypothetical protein [Gammaproteobacteria bacterium]
MLEEDIETIESGYEFLLAYAAQGRPAAVETGPGPHARPTIKNMADAMAGIAEQFSESNDSFEKVIANDCFNAGAALEFILRQDKVGSEMVDNLNASIHLRAVLTDLFLFSEVIKPTTAEELAESSASVVETFDAAKKKD